MANQIEEAAVKTFSMVPEIYQQAFKQQGADFPDDLVKAIKQDPNKAVQLLESDKNLKSAVVQIFQNNQEAIMKAIQNLKLGGIIGKYQFGGYFNDLPTEVYNENGKLLGLTNSPTIMAYINSRKEPRTWTFKEPTRLARINNTTNQSRMLWNPESLPEERVSIVERWYPSEGNGTKTSERIATYYPQRLPLRTLFKSGGTLKLK